MFAFFFWVSRGKELVRMDVDAIKHIPPALAFAATCIFDFQKNCWTKGEPGTKEIVKTLKALSECLKIGYPIYKGSIPLKKYLPFVSPNYVHKAYDDKVFWASFNTGS